MKINEILQQHEERIKVLEKKIAELTKKPQSFIDDKFNFSDKSKKYNELLEDLLKSEFCHSKNGLPFEKILEVFSLNNKPINPKKIRNLLAIWKKRKKVESIKLGGKLRYWMENG